MPASWFMCSHAGANVGCASIKAVKAAAKQPAPSGNYEATFFDTTTKLYCDMSGATKTYLVLPSTVITAGQVPSSLLFGCFLLDRW